ncbi:type VI secretion system baseplate subunit TssF [Burkholderia ubonensis]|uniref:type VI secretion system baseplate subunit TssF n=1 Tax=Burkholderia ubonensis TaxID=101571 RepID=UPI0009B41BC9
MDPRLLDYYNQELIYMRELAGEFAQAPPKIARRLGMQAGEVADPYVERLIESFCFMAARLQIKLDAEFPRFTERLLEVIYPNYVSPMPSMAVARLYPSRTEGNLAHGFRIARGTVFRARVPDGEKTACQFRSSQDVTLYPLEIVEARLTGIPPDIPALERYVPQDVVVRGALRLRLRTTNEAQIADLQGLDRLPIYLTGDEQVASHLFEMLHTASVASMTGAPGAFATAGDPPSTVSSDAVTLEGMDVDQGLLPLDWSKFHGHNLLHEYFACPSRFYFFTMTGLGEGLSRIHGRDVEIVVLLDQATERLANLVDASRFALFCTPVINLFRKRTDQIELSESDTEFRLVPSRLEPMDYEVFAVERLRGQVSSTSTEREFRPLYQTLNNDEGNHGRYFSACRPNGKPACVLDRSVVPNCTGDEAGSAMGVKSGTVGGEVKPTRGSGTVKIGGKAVARDGDPWTMNNGNCTGIFLTVPAPSGSVSPDGNVSGDASPPLDQDVMHQVEGFTRGADCASRDADEGRAYSGAGAAELSLLPLAAEGCSRSLVESITTSYIDAWNVAAYVSDVAEVAALADEGIVAMSRTSQSAKAGGNAISATVVAAKPAGDGLKVVKK